MKTEFLQAGEFVSCNLVSYVVAPLRVCELVEGFVFVSVTGDMMYGTVGVLEKFVDASKKYVTRRFGRFEVCFAVGNGV